MHSTIHFLGLLIVILLLLIAIGQLDIVHEQLSVLYGQHINEVVMTPLRMRLDLSKVPSGPHTIAPQYSTSVPTLLRQWRPPGDASSVTVT